MLFGHRFDTLLISINHACLSLDRVAALTTNVAKHFIGVDRRILCFSFGGEPIDDNVTFWARRNALIRKTFRADTKPFFFASLALSLIFIASLHLYDIHISIIIIIMHDCIFFFLPSKRTKISVYEYENAD